LFNLNIRLISTGPVRGKQRKNCFLYINLLGGDCMKKIIAISVMLVLIAGAAFADTSIGGGLQFHAKLLESGTDANGDSVVNSGGIIVPDCNTIFNVSFSGENAGGMMRLWSPAGPGNTGRPDWFKYFAFAWWRPIDQFKFQIGQNPDGEWGHTQITGWGFNAEAQNIVAIDQYNQWGGYIGNLSKVAIGGNAGWWGGYSAFGLYFSIFPAQGFEVNVGIPMADTNPRFFKYSFSAVFTNFV
jgi:hypothetical protein